MQFAYQFPERASGSCWSPAAGSGARSTCSCAPPRCPAPSSSCRCSPRAARARRRPRPSARRSAGSGSTPGADLARDRARLRVAGRAGARRAFVHTAARGDRPRRPARERQRPPAPRRGAADAARVGRAATRSSRPRTAARAHELDAGQPARALRGRRATSRTSTTRCASRGCCATSSPPPSRPTCSPSGRAS